MSTNVQLKTPFLRTTRNFPEDIKLISLEVNRAYVDIANAVNSRTISLFPAVRPAVTGESWYYNKDQRQQTLRQVYPFGAISPGAELDIPHGITNFVQFTKIYGTVITNVPDYRPLPYVDPFSATNNIAILVGTVSGKSQIRIIVGNTAFAVVSGLAILEWLVNV